MLLFFKLSFRNLIRNRVRTILNLSMVIGAFISIVFFRGFSNYILDSVENGVTRGQNGHIQIAKISTWNGDFLKLKDDALIENYFELEKKIRAIPNVDIVSGRSNGYVLLSNGDKSISAVAMGFDSKTEPSIEALLNFVEGQPFSVDPKFEILIGAGLQKSLNLKIGQTFSILSQTLKGSANSLDLELRGVVESGLRDIDNSTIYVPLTVMQKLLGTERIERIVILLKNKESLKETMTSIQTLLKSNPELLAKPWTETAKIFKQLTEFYFVQNMLVQIILSCLVFLGILNTLGLSIFERIGEIGTLRALGDQQSTVLIQLLLESLALGLVGVIIASPLAILLCTGFSALDVPVLMPGASRTMPVHVEPELIDFLIAALVIIVTCLVSSVWPAYRALKRPIVESLRANT